MYTYRIFDQISVDTAEYHINKTLKAIRNDIHKAYIFNLTKLFSKFYEQVNINNEENEILKSSRIRLLKCIIKVLENSLNILGIESINQL